MLNCEACPFYLDCKVETTVIETAFTAKVPDRETITPINEAECPLKLAVETVNQQLDKIRSLGIDK